MKIIIAEKPSLARNIVAAIDPKMKKRDGYYENDEYIVSYAFGHLFKLYDVEMYQPDYNPNQKVVWTEDPLPFFPEHFQFGLTRDEGIIHQFKIIRSLINQDATEAIINAGDSDREGEIIIRIILQYALKKECPIYRLWMPDQTPKTIKEELQKMRLDQEFDALANEGYARTYMDWCYGINLTRIATIRAKTLLRVGRVIAPIVEEIYNRDMTIKNFKPEKYFTLVSKEKTKGDVIELISKLEYPYNEKDKALQTIDIYNQEVARVTSIQSENKVIPPGKLYSLSKLQGELGKKYKMSLDHSLKIVQSLYEKGFISYPRTPSQYLAENEKGKFKEIIANFQKLNINIIFKDSKQIFDDSKIESHSALTPTYKIPKKSDLTEEEALVYKAISHRFFAVFAKEKCEVSHTNIEIDLGDKEKFRLSGDIVITKGWTIFEDREKKDKILPPLQVGDIVNTKFTLVEKQTTPPKHYTVETLNNFLKNPFKDQKKLINDENSDDLEEFKAMYEGVELGTEATRSSIIQHAIESKYISLKDNTYRLEENGRYYVESLRQMQMMMSKEKTAELGKSLKKVYRGEITIEDALTITKEEIQDLIMHSKNVALTNPPRIFEVDKSKILCKCPKCGNNIAITEKGFRCSLSTCGLALYYDNKLFGKLNKKVTKTLAKEIFTKGKVELKDLTSKNNTKYDAILVADYSNKYLSFRFEFPDNKNKD